MVGDRKNGYYTEKNVVEVTDEVGKMIVDVWQDEFNHFNKDLRRRREKDSGGKAKLIHITDENESYISAKDESENDPSILYEMKELNGSLYVGINKLPPEQREIIIALFFNGENLNEYVKRTGKERTKAARNLRKAFDFLRNEIE